MEDVMNVAFLGLGGNEGDRLAKLDESIKAIEEECGRLVLRSGIYETEAWGFISENAYLNQVIQIETVLKAEELMLKLLHIEKNLGRIRGVQQYSDREIDLDLLFFNTEIIHNKIVQVPHPRLHLRKFVLIPLCEIAPNYIHPELKKSVLELLETCADSSKVKAM